MNIEDCLYFAPDIPFYEVDTSGKTLPAQYKKRIEGYYLNPAQNLGKAGDGFAACLLLVCCIDAVSDFFGSGRSRKFIRWTQENLPSFKEGIFAEDFYKKVRNGLVHESRLKDGVVIDLKIRQTVVSCGKILMINPIRMEVEIHRALDSHIQNLEKDMNARKNFIKRVRRKFRRELSRAGV